MDTVSSGGAVFGQIEAWSPFKQGSHPNSTNPGHPKTTSCQYPSVVRHGLPEFLPDAFLLHWQGYVLTAASFCPNVCS